MADAGITVAAVIDSSGAVAGANRFNAALGTMRSNVAAAGTSIQSLASGFFSLQGILGTVAGALTARSFIEAGDNFLSLKAKLALFAQAGVSANDILDGLVAAAQRANAPILDLKNTFTRNASALNQLGYSTSEQKRE